MQEVFVILDKSDEVPILSETRGETHTLWDSMIVNRSRLEQNHDWTYQQRQHQRTKLSQLQMQSQRIKMYFSRLRQSNGITKGSRVSRTTLQMQEQQDVDVHLDMSFQKTKKEQSDSLDSALDDVQPIETVSSTRSTFLKSTSSSVEDFTPALLPNDHVAVRTDIMTRMDKIYAEAKAIIKVFTGAAASVPALTCHYNVKLDPKIGPIKLLTLETPLDCSLIIAKEMLSKCIFVPDSFLPSLKSKLYPDVERELVTDRGDSIKANYPDGIGFSRRHEEKNCELFVWAAISFHESDKIMFRENLWMAAIHLAPSISQGSVIRINYSVSAVKANDCTFINDEHIDQVRDQALEAIAAKMRKNLHMLQIKMLMETGRADLASFIT